MMSGVGARKRSQRRISILRKMYPGGKWTYEGASNYARDDGLKIYCLSHCDIGVGGGETYRSVWYVERPGAPPDSLEGIALAAALGEDPFRTWTE